MMMMMKKKNKKTGFKSAQLLVRLFVAFIGLLNACCGRKRAECVCHPSEKLSYSVKYI